MRKHSTQVREANLLDLLPLAILSELYVSEVETMNLHPFCPETLMRNMAASILSPDAFVSVLTNEAGEIVGSIWGVLTSHPWSSAVFAQDVALFVHPDYRDGSGLKLIRAWVKWSKDKGAKEVYLSTASGIHTEKFIKLTERLGFQSAGYISRKEV